MLNPIEEAFSTWKACVKRELALPETTSRLNDASAALVMGSNLQEYRMGILQQVGEAALPVLTGDKINHWYNHSLSFFPRCQNLEDV